MEAHRCSCKVRERMRSLVKVKWIEFSLRLLISFALVLVFYFMFGAQNMDRIKAKDIEITINEEDTSIIQSPSRC